MENVHGVIGEEPEVVEYRHGALGRGTIALAALGIAYGIWSGRYFLSVATMLTAFMLVLWIQRQESLIKLVHWAVFLGVLLGAIYYVFFSQPELFLVLDTYLIPHRTEQAQHPGFDIR